jgi:DNA-nicking Smr family endonuclease
MYEEDSSPFELEITDTLDLHPFAPRDVNAVVEEYISLCSKKGIRLARIIHGKGSGIQREIVRSVLQKSSLVESFENGPDWGSTALTLKVAK